MHYQTTLLLKYLFKKIDGVFQIIFKDTPSILRKQKTLLVSYWLRTISWVWTRYWSWIYFSAFNLN